MKLKTLLLGSAAAFAVVGGAQAADLSVAEPVEYVKACEAFGAGYYYIPGSDTCLQITGNVEFFANFHQNQATVSSDGTHSASWDFVTDGGVYFDAKSMTDVGVLEASIGFKGTYSGSDFGTDGAPVGLDGAWLKLGGLKAGHFGSTFNPGGSYVDDFGLANEVKSSLADSNHLELSFKAANIGLALGIEDPRVSFGSSLPDTYSLPLITGNLTASGSAWSGFLSAGYTEVQDAGNFGVISNSSWGVDGELTFNIDANNHFIVNAAYGDNPFIGGGLWGSTLPGTPGWPTTIGANNGWSAFASLRHSFSSTLRTDFDFSYLQFAEPSALPSINEYKVAGDLVWLPYAGFKAKVGVGYIKPNNGSGVWSAQVGLRRDW